MMTCNAILLDLHPKSRCAGHTVVSAQPSSTQQSSSHMKSWCFSYEILQQIFLYCAADSVGYLDAAECPLVLCRVSHIWKTIANSTPGLWSTIVLTTPHFIPANVQVIKEWLQHSGTTYPLDITINAPNHLDPFLLAAILAEFMPYCHRWRTLSLGIPDAYIPMMLSNPVVPLPSLEHLTLGISFQSSLAIDDSATRLQRVTLGLYPPLVLPLGNFLDFAWGQVTDLDIRTTAVAIEAIWEILCQCPQLYSLAVTAASSFLIHPVTYHHGVLIHMSLRHLALFIDVLPEVISYFLDRLSLPYFEELRLYFIDQDSNPWLWPKMAILELRERSLPPLTRLSVTGKLVSEADLVDFVRRMKYLEQLVVMYGPRDLVTPGTRFLMPQSDFAVERQRAAYRAELGRAGFYGRVV